jgi:hypothetical protein
MQQTFRKSEEIGSHLVLDTKIQTDGRVHYLAYHGLLIRNRQLQQQDISILRRRSLGGQLVPIGARGEGRFVTRVTIWRAEGLAL